MAIDMTNITKIHLRYQGNSYELNTADLDIGDSPTENDIKTAVERHMDYNPGALDSLEIDRYSDCLDIVPSAKFG